MARIHQHLPPPAASVLDRLIDEAVEPDGRDPERTYAQGLAEVRAAVLRDLGWLLNARLVNPVPAEPSRPPSVDEAGDVLAFGLEDLTLLNLRERRGREELRQRILDAVERFEPRLQEVRVHVDTEDLLHGGTRFRIEGRLLVEPEPVDFPFMATVRWSPRTLTLEEGDS